MATQKEISDFTEAELKKQVLFARQRFGLGARWSPKLELDFEDKSGISYGGVNTNGKPFLYLSIKHLLLPIGGYKEYEAYETDKDIGDIRTRNWKVYLKSLIAHELAHAVQYSIPYINTPLRDKKIPSFYHGLGYFQGDHHPFFRNIYRILRGKFVNCHIAKDFRGITPLPVPGSDLTKGWNFDHEYVGERFHHPRYGKCTVLAHVNRMKKYKIMYLSECGVYTRRCSVADFLKNKA